MAQEEDRTDQLWKDYRAAMVDARSSNSSPADIAALIEQGIAIVKLADGHDPVTTLRKQQASR